MSSPSPSSSNDQRNTEIWSTRLQRELLAMTTDNAPEDAKKEMTAVLPSFCTMREHSLDIERGNCTVTYLLDLPPSHVIEQQENNNTSAEAAESSKETETNATKTEGEGTTNDTSDKEAKDSLEEEKSASEETTFAPITITLNVSLQKKDGSVA